MKKAVWLKKFVFVFGTMAVSGLLLFGCFGDDSDDPAAVSDTIPPTVLSTVPVDTPTKDYSVIDGNTITITFSEEIDPATLTVQTADGTCTGSIQITTSTDNFTSMCRAFSSSITSTDNKTFTFTKATNFGSGGEYKLKVTSAVKDKAGNAMSADWVMADGFEIL